MFINQKIFILGFARSGYEAAKFLIDRGNTVLVNDGGAEEKHDPVKIKELRDKGVTFVFGSHPDDLLDSSYDYFIKNPGVPIDHKLVLQARNLGIEVINEVEMAYRLLPSDVSMIGITGTNGKTTTTTLTYKIMSAYYGDRVHLAGNIGYPLCSILNKLKPNDFIVMEVSCQQGENFKEFHPHVGVFTNLTEAHVDFMHTYQHYMDVKTCMFLNQSSSDIAILNQENSDVLNQTKDIKSIKKYFSSKSDALCHLEDNYIIYNGEKIIALNEIKIKGMHNVENCMCAISAVKEYGVPNEVIRDVISKFTGVEHRLEYVNTVHGVSYYNDTEATNIKCTQIALSSFTEPTIIFLGGLERGQDFNELSDYMKHVKCVFAIGQCRSRVEEFSRTLGIEVYSYEHLSDAFKKSLEVSKPGDVVLLSPASASWDQYKECEVRGKEFKDLVNAIEK